MIDPKLLKESISIEEHSAKDSEVPQSISMVLTSDTRNINNYLELLPAELWLELAKYNVADYGYMLKSFTPLPESGRTYWSGLERFAGLTGTRSTEDHNLAGFAVAPDLSDFEHDSNSPRDAGGFYGSRDHQARAYEETPPSAHASAAQDMAPAHPEHARPLSKSLSLPNLTMERQHPVETSAESTDYQVDISAPTENLSYDLSPVSTLRSINKSSITTDWREKMRQWYGINSEEPDTRPSLIARSSSVALKPPAAAITRSSSLTHIAIKANEDVYRDTRPATSDYNRAAASIRQIQHQ